MLIAKITFDQSLQQSIWQAGGFIVFKRAFVLSDVCVIAEIVYCARTSQLQFFTCSNVSYQKGFHARSDEGVLRKL